MSQEDPDEAEEDDDEAGDAVINIPLIFFLF
jgi:hypothetical protein